MGGDLLVRSSAPGSLVEPGEGRALAGHFAVFNTFTTITAWRENDGQPFLERIAPGAFLRTMSEDRAAMRVLFEHGRDPVMGDKPIATILTLREDEIGAFYEAPLLDGVPDLIVSGLRANQYGASFAFQVMADEFVTDPGTSEYNPLGLAERTIREVRVREFGPCTFGAYPTATAGVRSMTDWYHNATQRQAA